MKKLSLVVLLAGFLIACGSKETQSTGSYALDPEAFKAKVESGAVLIDVRTVEEYAEGHLANSLNVDFNNPAFKDNILILDKNKEYAVYCASGVRSGKAADLMRAEGFGAVYTLTGGIKTWKEKGLPLE